ncbi:MAG: hypothetical protein Q7T11_02350 [Deltaproteobacteria bacterium]|nr:hypothetical protein [Deltaproteobacteria bacterium]
MSLKNLQEKYRELAARFFEKKHDRVLKDARAALTANPEDLRAKLKLAEAHFKAHQADLAIAAYREVAEAYTRDNFILKAAAIYKNILKLDPTAIETNLKLAELYQKLEMTSDAVTQYRIALQAFEAAEAKEKLLSIGKKLVEIDPSPANRRKLAEILIANRMTKEALEQYGILAQTYRDEKKYDDLLRIYEIMLPHIGENRGIIKDVCILYLRRQEPEKAIRTVEKYKLDTEPQFSELYDKAKLMMKALRSTKGKT